jgi:hypothetical protein
MNDKNALPEICCDLNARMTENGYLLETHGAVKDLAKLGLTLEQAVGKRFLFNGGADTTENGESAEIVFHSVVSRDPVWGYLAVCDSNGLHWRVVQHAEQTVAADRPKTGAG